MMEDLIEDIKQYMKMFKCISAKRSKIKEMLEARDIKDAYEFGKFYNYTNPHRSFAKEYLFEL